MKIIKNVWGHTVELDFIKVKDFNRHTLYQVSKDGVKLYKESLTDDQLKRIVLNGYKYLNDKEYGRCE